MLDAIGPYEVLRNMPGAEVIMVAKKKGEVPADTNMVHLLAKHELSEVQQADVLLIPGSTVAFIREMKDKAVLEWIRTMDAHTQFTVSVCTGSLILAATGLLQGKSATSHWKPIGMLRHFGVKSISARMVQQGKYITAAGVSAGIDMALHLVSKLAGEETAQAAQLGIEYDPDPPFQMGHPSKASKQVIQLAEAQMERDARKDLSLWEMLKHARSLWKLRQS